eukprot:scaffold11999_cov88-Phaeocystis_antarctica.AAC.2
MLARRGAFWRAIASICPAVIEASFGDFHDFNRVARNLFASRMSSRRSRSFDIRAFPVARS